MARVPDLDSGSRKFESYLSDMTYEEVITQHYKQHPDYCYCHICKLPLEDQAMIAMDSGVKYNSEYWKKLSDFLLFKVFNEQE